MGSVYRAEQVSLRRTVALKVMAPDLAGSQEFRQRFLRESLVAAHIEHPNILSIYEAGEAEGLLFIAMRYVEGTDLGTLLRRDGRLSIQNTLALVDQAAAALDAAHSRGLVHRDVKPANLLLANGHLYLSDFGIARSVAADTSVTRTGAFLGSVDYAAPEQIRNGIVDRRADVYALGRVLFQCLTGVVPYERVSEFAKMRAHLEDAAPRLSAYRPELPQGLDVVVARALAKDPRKRFQAAGALAAAARAEVTPSNATVDSVLPSTGVDTSRKRVPLSEKARRGTTLLGLAVVGVAFIVVANFRLSNAQTASGLAPVYSSPSLAIVSTSPPAASASPTVTNAPARACDASSLTTYPARGEGRNLCSIPVSFESGRPPMLASWDESRAGDDITTSLTIYQLGSSGREERLWFGSAKMTLNYGGQALQSVTSFYPVANGPAQLAYTVASCGANCGQTDVVVLAVVNGQLTEVLRTSVDRGWFEWNGTNVLIHSPFYGQFDSRCCPSAYKADVYRWTGVSYEKVNTILLPTPTPSR